MKMKTSFMTVFDRVGKFPGDAVTTVGMFAF